MRVNTRSGAFLNFINRGASPIFIDTVFDLPPPKSIVSVISSIAVVVAVNALAFMAAIRILRIGKLSSDIWPCVLHSVIESNVPRVPMPIH